jgi:hypothetical protein
VIRNNIPRRIDSYKRSKRSKIIKFFLVEFLYEKILFAVIVPIFISLATFSYISNNFSGILKHENNIDELSRQFTSTGEITNGPGQVNIEDFHFTVDDAYQENGKYIVVIHIAPINGKKSSDYYVKINNQDEKIKLNNVCLTIDQNTKGTTYYSIGVYSNKGVLVNNLLSIELTNDFKEKLRTLIEQKPKNNIAKWFLDTFK